MPSEKDDVSFPKLGERNYRSWSAQCKAALMRKKCWRLVSGAWTCPPTSDLGYDSWMEMNEMACGIIFGLLDETHQNLVLDEFSVRVCIQWMSANDKKLDTAKTSEVWESIYTATLER